MLKGFYFMEMQIMFSIRFVIKMNDSPVTCSLLRPLILTSLALT